MFRRSFKIWAVLAVACAAHVDALGLHWVTSWAASIQGPYPIGATLAQPNLSLVFPTPASTSDQSFRLIVKPDIWGPQARIRLSNVFGTAPVTFDGVYIGLQMSGAALLPGTNRAVAFNHKSTVTIQPGESSWSDPVSLPFAASPQIAGRKLAISFHIAGPSGPMTWHAKALTTSYLSAGPGSGAKGSEEGEDSFPFPTTSWYFLDAVDMMAPPVTHTVVAFGDSITDGTDSTMNGDDRWPDVLSRRLHTAFGNQFAVVNAGIGGNQVVGPATYSATAPARGGPSALQRLDRDILTLSSVAAVIWLEGINDFSPNGNATVEAVEAGMKEGVSRLRAKIPGIRIVGATVTSAVGSTSSSPEREAQRQSLNQFIRTSGLFDAVADFDKATVDLKTAGLRAEFVPDSTIGGPGDHLHPNRLGYRAMGMAVDLDSLKPKPAR